jgi:hypothetical protein
MLFSEHAKPQCYLVCGPSLPIIFFHPVAMLLTSRCFRAGVMATLAPSTCYHLHTWIAMDSSTCTTFIANSFLLLSLKFCHFLVYIKHSNFFIHNDIKSQIYQVVAYVYLVCSGLILEWTEVIIRCQVSTLISSMNEMLMSGVVVFWCSGMSEWVQCDSFFFFLLSSFLIVLFWFLNSYCDPSEDVST